MGRPLQVKPESPTKIQRRALTDAEREAIREKFRPKISDPEICNRVLELRSHGKNIADIAAEAKLSPGTVQKILARYGDPFAESMGIIKTKLPAITAMVMDEVLSNKDRRTGALILERTGLLDGVRPKVEPQEDGGRIVIEWSGAPPPWAPRTVLDAYAAKNSPSQLPTAIPYKGQAPTCAKVGTDATSCPAPADVVDVVVEDLPSGQANDSPQNSVHD